jgi:hypothetical protein
MGHAQSARWNLGPSGQAFDSPTHGIATVDQASNIDPLRSSRRPVPTIPADDNAGGHFCASGEKRRESGSQRDGRVSTAPSIGGGPPCLKGTAVYHDALAGHPPSRV